MQHVCINHHLYFGSPIGGLSIFAQYTKDRERRKKIEDAMSIPAVLALFGTISWLIFHAHHLDDLGVSQITLVIALAFFLLIPAVTYVFSPAFKDVSDDTHQQQVHSQNYTTQHQARWASRPSSPNACHSVVTLHADDIFIIDGVVMYDSEIYQVPRLTQ